MGERAPQNILVLLTGLFDTYGGIQTLNRTLVKAFDALAAEKSWTVTILVLNDRENKKALDRYYSPDRIKYSFFSRRKTRFLFSAVTESKSKSILYFGHAGFLPAAPLLRWIRPGSRFLSIVHGVEAWKPFSPLQRLGAGRLDKMVSISRATQQTFLKANPFDQMHFEILPPSVDPCFGQTGNLKSRNDLGLPKGKMILSVSRLDASEGPKKIDWVIQSLPQILQRVPDAFYVVLGGAYDGSDLERLKKVASDSGVADKVIFLGEVADELRASYYEACDAFVLPSVKEGFGIVFLEAMFYGKPCIGSKTGGVPEVIEDAKTGFLLDPDSPK